MSKVGRSSARRIEHALRDVEKLHPSPADASDADVDWLADVDELDDVVWGGLGRDGISTASVNGGLQRTRDIQTAHTDRMSAEQRAALDALGDALRGA